MTPTLIDTLTPRRLFLEYARVMSPEREKMSFVMWDDDGVQEGDADADAEPQVPVRLRGQRARGRREVP
jgi:hypothetical protein